MPRVEMLPQPPRILRKSLLAGAREAEGVAVVIDVLRAFTSAALMMHLGAEKIILRQVIPSTASSAICSTLSPSPPLKERTWWPGA
jgi:hypothetical protein